MLPDARFYVYVIFRPTGSPCYVGKGRGYRYKEHVYRKNRHNPHLANIVKKAGSDVPIVVLRSGMIEAAAFEMERAFIAAIGRGKNGPLVNMTDGGEGASGAVVSEATRQKLRKSSTGRVPSETTRSKISDSNRGLWADSSFRSRVVAGNTGRRKSPETLKKMSEATAAHMTNPDRRKTASDVLTRRMADPEQRRQVGISARISWCKRKADSACNEAVLTALSLAA